MKDLELALKEIEDEGLIPYELDYNLENNYTNKIDWNALIYDDWNLLDYWINKLPDGLLSQYPQLYEFVVDFANSKKGITPLMELEERAKLRESKAK
jgi:hypothetical protein